MSDAEEKHPNANGRAGNPELYDDLVGYLEQVPILKWACHRAKLAPASVYEKMKRNPELEVRIREAQAIGQGRFIPGASPDRILAWSDPEGFSLKQEHSVESDITINIVGEGLGLDADESETDEA